MRGDPGERWSIPSAFVRGLSVLVLAHAWLGCVTEREPRAEPAPEQRPPPFALEPAEESEEEEEEAQPTPEQRPPPFALEPSEEPEEEVWPGSTETDAPEEKARADTEAEEVWPGTTGARAQQTQEGAAAPGEQGAPSTSTTGEVPSDSWTAQPASGPDWLHGSLAVRYRGRTNGDDGDHDLGALLALDVVNPDAPWISAHLQARADADLDGTDSNDPFGSLNDTYDKSVVAKLYLAYVDIALDENVDDSPGTLRIGRQSDPLLPEVVRLDGVSYWTNPLGEKEVQLGAYGGIPVHLYESSNDGDRAFGAFVEGRPWRGGRTRFDWMHLEDEDVLGEGEDDLLALGWWQSLAERWRFETEYTHLEGDPRDLSLRGFWGDAETGTTVRLAYYELLETQRALVTELDPFFEELLDYFPFRQVTLNASRGFGEHVVADAGIDVRRVSDSDDIGEFNRNWDRYYATGTYNDLGTEGLALSLTLDYWNDDEERDTSTIGADLSYTEEDHWRAAVGTYYSLYKYEFLELDERDDVRTYYLRTTYDVSDRLEVELLYELENDDLDTYHTLRVGPRWRF